MPHDNRVDTLGIRNMIEKRNKHKTFDYIFLTGKYMFRVRGLNTRLQRWILSKLAIKKLENVANYLFTDKFEQNVIFNFEFVFTSWDVT